MKKPVKGLLALSFMVFAFLAQPLLHAEEKETLTAEEAAEAQKNWKKRKKN